MNDIVIKKIAENLYNEFISVLNQLKQEDSIRKSKKLVFQLLLKFNGYNRFIVANQLEDEIEYDSSVMFDFSEIVSSTIRYYWQPCLSCPLLTEFYKGND